MKILYQCEVCGYTSENQKLVRSCEARGTTARFAEKQQVFFVHPGTGYEIAGIIAEAVHAPRTHAVRYRVFVGIDARLGRNQNCIYTIPEPSAYVRAPSPAIPA